MGRVLSAIVLLGSGCSLTEVEGELNVRSHGEGWVFAPDDCISGEPFGWFGVELRDGKGARAALVHDPIEGLVVGITRRGETVGPAFAAGDCREQRGELVRTDLEINEVWAMRGNLMLDCAIEGDSSILGEVRFEGCAD